MTVRQFCLAVGAFVVLVSCGGGSDGGDASSLTVGPAGDASATDPVDDDPATTQAPEFSRETQLAVLECSEQLMSAPPNFMRGGTLACDDAENLATLDGGPVGAALAQEVADCQLALARAAEVEDAEQEIDELFDCAEELRTSVTD